jgi:phospholipid/cholesterol/gamma-HCH transport system substrate-binding protein
MKFTKEIKIALVAILAIVVLFFGLQFLKGLTIFSNDDSYYVTFNDVSGLSPSSPIYANGYKVGVVKDIIYDYSPEGKIVAVMGLDKNMRLPQGSHAEIASDLLGNIKVNLVLGDDPLHMLAAGDTISGGAELGMMSKLGSMMPAVEAILPKLDSIMSSLNVLLADPALRNTLHNVEGMTGNLNATSQELRSLSASLNRDVPGMMHKANGVLDNTQQLTKNLSAVDVAAMTASVNKTLENVEQMTRKLNSNEGTLGLLMRDASLYNNLTATAASADSLLIDLKAHPKRYVHFSIFGKSDKQK